MSPLKITLKVVRKPMFVYEDFDGVDFAAAVQSAISGLCNGDRTPDEDYILEVDAYEVEMDGRRIHLTYDLDWPRAGDPSHRWIIRAHEGITKLAEGYEVGNVIAEAFRALEAREAAS